MYTEKDLVRIAKRQNNARRNYLVVNPLQGKHVPIQPDRALGMFRQLARIIQKEYKNETLLLIGFAETATAVGAAAAIETGAAYMQTTREIIPGAEYLFFTEEHSHATEQKLVKEDVDQVIGRTDRILFVEDEVTTGKTICNIIDLLKKAYPAEKLKFSAASLLNGMDESAWNVYKERGIRLHYLVKTDCGGYSAAAEAAASDGVYVPCSTQAVPVEEFWIDSWVNARRLVDPEQYRQGCRYLWNETARRLSGELSGRVLVLGTEEFMYPALYAAEKIRQRGADTVFHATTRSPVIVSSQEEYPLHVRYELRSLYDKNRVTYLYDIGAYDTVLIITDSHSREPEGIYSLINALRHKNKNIYLVRWC